MSSPPPIAEASLRAQIAAHRRHRARAADAARYHRSGASPPAAPRAPTSCSSKRRCNRRSQPARRCAASSRKSATCWPPTSARCRPTTPEANSISIRCILPAELPVSVPSKFVEQRPDVRQYSALLHAGHRPDRRRDGQPAAAAHASPAATAAIATQFADVFSPASVVWSIAGVGHPAAVQGRPADASAPRRRGRSAGSGRQLQSHGAYGVSKCLQYPVRPAGRRGRARGRDRAPSARRPAASS